MKIKDMHNKFRLVTLAIAGMVFITMTVIFLSVEGFTKMKQGDYIKNISFSPDGKKIIFDRRKGDSKRYMIHLYDLETGELVVYKLSHDKEFWHMPKLLFRWEAYRFHSE